MGDELNLDGLVEPLNVNGLVEPSRTPKPTSSHLPELEAFFKANGLTIGSTTTGTHNPGSKHYSGNAIDVRGSGGFSNARVAQLQSLAAQSGLKIRDERQRPKGQLVWGGSHIHVEYAGGQQPQQPNDGLNLDGLVEPLNVDGLVDSVVPPVPMPLKGGARSVFGQSPQSKAPISKSLKGGASSIFGAPSSGDPLLDKLRASAQAQGLTPEKLKAQRDNLIRNNSPLLTHSTVVRNLLDTVGIAAADTNDALAGVLRWFGGDQTAAAKWLKESASGLRNVSAQSQEVSPSHPITQFAKETGASVLSFLPLMVVPGGPEVEGAGLLGRVGAAALRAAPKMLAGGAYSAAQTAGRGGTAGQQAKSGASGAAMFGMLDVPLPGKRIITKALSNLVITGGGTTIISLATGAPLSDAAKSGLAMTLLRSPELLRGIKVRTDNGVRPATAEDVSRVIGDVGMKPTSMPEIPDVPVSSILEPRVIKGGGLNLKGIVESAQQPAEAASQPTATVQPEAAQLASAETAASMPEIVKPYEMTRSQIEEEFQRKKAEDDNLEASILGPELAKKYAQLQRSANSSYDTDKANRASDDIQKIEDSLSEADRNRLYGIGETGPQLDDLRAYRQSLGNLDDSDPQSLAESMRWAVSRVGNETDPTKMTHEQQVAYGTLREAARIAHENGWDTQAISREAVKAAAGRFSDPEDAQFMLDRFLKKESPATAPQPKQIAAESSSITPLEQPVTKTETLLDLKGIVEPTQSTSSQGGVTPEVPQDTTGIAHRVETAARGQEPPRGEGIGAQESVERGRQLLRDGSDPQEAIDAFRESGAVSAESMALVRARHEELAQVANRAFDAGGQKLDSPEFQAAEKARQDFYDNSVKPMQTAWSNTGRAQQGETDIDTGTFYGLYRAFKDSKAREPSPSEAVTMNRLAQRNAGVESDVKNLSAQLATELNKAAGIHDLPPDVQTAISRFVDQAKRESRRTGRQATRKALDVEAATIKQNIAAAFQKVKDQTGIQPSGLARLDPEGEITKQLIAYAKNRVKAGVTDAAQLVDDVHGAIKDFADVTKREATEAILGQGAPKGQRIESDWAKTKKGVAESLKSQDVETARQELGVRLQANPRSVSQADAKAVWDYVRENYVDKGNNDFADVRTKAASDLGIAPETVTRALASTTATKRISDEMWAKMSDRRQMRSNAESWVRQADSGIATKAFENLRRLWFLKATIGHGAVAPFTHAPANAFIPSRWGDFWSNFGKTYQFMASKGGHEQSMVDLENSPTFDMARRGGLANDPKRGYDEYQSLWMGKALGRLGISGNRAFDALKTMRQDMFDSEWDKLTDDLKTPEMVKGLSQEINASTGASKALSGQDWPSRFASKAMFAAPLEASRWDFLVRDNYRAMKAFTSKSATPEEMYMAKRVASRNAQLVATYGVLLAANQGMLIAAGSKDKLNVTDPTKSDFLAFKVGGHVISPAGGMLTAIRFVGSLASIGLEDKKAAVKADDAAKTFFNYGRSKLSPLFGTGADLWLQSDYMKRPLPFSKQRGTRFAPRYTWAEYVLSAQTPIPIAEAARTYYEERKKGTSAAVAIAHAVPVGAVAGTGIRVREDFQSRRSGTSRKNWLQRWVSPVPPVPTLPANELR